MNMQTYWMFTQTVTYTKSNIEAGGVMRAKP